MKATLTLPPPPIHGIHGAIYRCCAILRDRGVSLSNARNLVYNWRDKHSFRRPVPDSELDDALHSVFKTARTRLLRPEKSSPLEAVGINDLTHEEMSSNVDAPYFDKAKAKAPNPALRAQLINTSFGLADLRAQSPIRFKVKTGITHSTLRCLYPNNPWLCCGWSKSTFATHRLRDWLKLAPPQFIVPSPMIAKFAPRKKDGRPSQHSLSGTGEWGFITLDFDDCSGPDIQAATIVYLADRFGYHLALVLGTGGKGLHGWLRVQGKSLIELQDFMGVAFEMGADPRMFIRSQFARMPGAWRDNGNLQEVHYFNPHIRHESR